MMFTPGTIWQIAQHSAHDSADSQRRDETIVLYAVKTPDPPPPIAWLAALTQTTSSSNGDGGDTVDVGVATPITCGRVPGLRVVPSAVGRWLRLENRQLLRRPMTATLQTFALGKPPRLCVSPSTGSFCSCRAPALPVICR